MGERENRGLKKGNKPNEMLSNDQSNETSIMTKDDSDEDLGTIDEVVQPKVKVAYKNPSISKKSNLKKPGPEENQSSGGVTAFNLPTPDSAAWGKIKTPIEELKVRFVVIGDEPTTKIEGWYNLEPLKNVKRESEEYGVDFSNLAYAMKLVSSDENDDVELIITRRSKRANKELPQSGSIHIMFPFIGNASKEEPTLHELRRRTLSSKSLTKKLQKKNQISSSSNFVKGSTIANDDDISLPSLDHNYQRKISKQAKLSSQPTPVEETEEMIIRTLQNGLSFSAEKSSNKGNLLRKRLTKYSLVSNQKAYSVFEKNSQNLERFNGEGNLNLVCKSSKKSVPKRISEIINYYERDVELKKSKLNVCKFEIFCVVISIANCIFLYTIHCCILASVTLKYYMQSLFQHRTKDMEKCTDINMRKIKKVKKGIYCANLNTVKLQDKFISYSINIFEDYLPFDNCKVLLYKGETPLLEENKIHPFGYGNIHTCPFKLNKEISPHNYTSWNLRYYEIYLTLNYFPSVNVKHRRTNIIIKNKFRFIDIKRYRSFNYRKIKKEYRFVKNNKSNAYKEWLRNKTGLTLGKYEPSIITKESDHCSKPSFLRYETWLKAEKLPEHPAMLQSRFLHKKFVNNKKRLFFTNNKFNLRKYKAVKKFRLNYFDKNNYNNIELKLYRGTSKWKEKIKKGQRRVQARKHKWKDSQDNSIIRRIEAELFIYHHGHKPIMLPTDNYKTKSAAGNPSKNKRGTKPSRSSSKSDSVKASKPDNQEKGSSKKSNRKTRDNSRKGTKPGRNLGKQKNKSKDSLNSSASSNESKKSKKSKKGKGCCGGKPKKEDVKAKPKKPPDDKTSKTPPPVSKTFDASAGGLSPTPSTQSGVNLSPTPSEKAEMSDVSSGKSEEIKVSSGKLEEVRTIEEPVKPAEFSENKRFGEEKRVYEAQPGDKRGDIYGKLAGGPIRLPIFPEPCCDPGPPCYCDQSKQPPDLITRKGSCPPAPCKPLTTFCSRKPPEGIRDSESEKQTGSGKRGGLCGLFGSCSSGGLCKLCGQKGPCGPGGMCGKCCSGILSPFRKILCKNKNTESNSHTVYGKYRAVANYETGELNISVDRNSRRKLRGMFNTFAVEYDKRVRKK